MPMGNQLSATARQKNSPSTNRGTTPPPTPLSEAPAPQQNSKPFAAREKLLPRLKLAIRGAKSSSSPSWSPSSSPSHLPSSGYTTQRQHSTGNDGASTPNETPSDEKYHNVIPASSLMTEVQYLSLSLHTESPSEASTITPAIRNVSSPPPPSPPPEVTWSQTVSSPPQSSMGRSFSRPQSSNSSVLLSHPLFPGGTERLERIPAPPVLPSHLNCYQTHRRMLHSPNAQHPVPCSTCGVDDEEARWRCVWCYIRICGQCMEFLHKTKGRDLSLLMMTLDGRNAHHGRDEAENETVSSGEGDDIVQRD